MERFKVVSPIWTGLEIQTIIYTGLWFSMKTILAFYSVRTYGNHSEVWSMFENIILNRFSGLKFDMDGKLSR